jgi:hypothetical protein
MKDELLKVVELLDKLGEKKDQSFTLCLHYDGSGSIDEFWTELPVCLFDNIEQLIKILNEATVTAEAGPDLSD